VHPLHVGGLLDPSDTANTLIARSVFFDPHDGHAGAASSTIVRTSFSNFVLHFPQVYS